MENLPSLNQKLKEYLECDSRIILMKNGIATNVSKAELKMRILCARRTFENAGLKQGDMVIFQINGDDQVNFILYASADILDNMADWYSFASRNAGDIPLEISASRIDDKTFIVHSLASTDGEMDFDTLVIDYQVYYAFIGCAIVLALALASITLFILWVVKKRKH